MSSPAENILHARLLDLHKVLLDQVRAEYEAEHGPVPGPGALLQLVTQDEAFAWLRPLSMLLIELDDPEVLARAGGPRLLTESVFTAGNKFYDRFVEVSSLPTVTAAYEEVRRALKALPLPA